jgi:heat shock protein HslJ
MKGNAGQYSEVEPLFSADLQSLMHSPQAAAGGGIKSFCDGNTRGGTITAVDVVSEEIKGEGAKVVVNIHFKDGTTKEHDSNSLIKEKRLVETGGGLILVRLSVLPGNPHLRARHKKELLSRCITVTLEEAHVKMLRWTTLAGMAVAVIILSIAAGSAGAQQPSVVGKYFSESHPESQYYIELRADRTFVISGSGGRAMIGTYEVEGNQITLKAQMQAPARFRLVGKTLIDPDGERWTQKSTSALAQSPRQEAAPGAGTSKEEVQQSSVAGKYFSETHPEYYIELKSDRTFVIPGNGRAMIGTYEVEGDQITLKAQMQRPAQFKLLGKTLIDPEGGRWTQKPTSPLAQSPTQEAGPGAGTSRAANAGAAPSSKYPQGDTILIGTETIPVRVKNFYRNSKGTDEYGGVILEKTPSYVISYNENMSCFETSQHQGCFGIDLADGFVRSDQLRAEKLLMTRLAVSRADFCKLPIAVTILEDKVTGSKVSTPPSPCPNGALY